VPERLGALESVFAVGNGYLGIRGTPEEGTPSRDPGVILDGFHDTWPSVYPEDAFGLARTGQTVVNATDGSRIRLFVDDEPFDLMTGRIVDFWRAIDMRIGVLRRELIWESPSGTRLLIRSRRLASLEDRHLAAMSYEVTPLRSGARVEIASELVTHRGPQASGDPRGHGALAEATLVPVSSHAAGRRAVVRLATGSSGLQLACGMGHTIAATGLDRLRRVREAGRSCGGGRWHGTCGESGRCRRRASPPRRPPRSPARGGAP
jgi:alpha,alpha-trehalose phosphorylase